MVGRVVDPETGLIYLRARYYDPQTAQFISVDPLVAITGSAYGYVNGDPLNGSDPTGLKFCLHNPFGHDNCQSTWKTHPGIHGPLIAAVIVPLLVAGAACVVATAGICAGVTPGIAAALGSAGGTAGSNFSSEENLLSHFTAHAGEFGSECPNAQAYLQGARGLVSGGPGIESFTRSSDEAQLFYRTATNEFAVLHPDGTIGTYFRPAGDGAAYWARQVARG